MVVRGEQLPDEMRDSSLRLATSDGQARPSQNHSTPLVEQTVVEETATESSASQEVDQITAAETAEETRSVHGRRKTSSFVSDCERSRARDSSCEDDRSCDSRLSQRSVRRDRSNTWSHSALTFRPARRSGSLPPMDGNMTHVQKLPLSMDRSDSPFPSSPTCMSPHRLNKLLVCSEHRMSTSPRLPPIGYPSDRFSPRNLPKNCPRELTREVTFIDPALVDNSDPTDIRMMGRRRNALVTPQPTVPDSEDS